MAPVLCLKGRRHAALEQMAISHVQLEDMAVLLPWSNGNSHPSLTANCFRACREALMLAFLAFASSVGSSCPLPSKRADNRGSRSHPVFASTSANIWLRVKPLCIYRLSLVGWLPRILVQRVLKALRICHAKQLLLGKLSFKLAELLILKLELQQK
jgi:hypothetical protein